MGDGTALAEQWLAECQAIRGRIAAARGNLAIVLENVLFDLGEVGRRAVRDILEEIGSELDAIEALCPEVEAP